MKASVGLSAVLVVVAVSCGDGDTASTSASTTVPPALTTVSTTTTTTAIGCDTAIARAAAPIRRGEGIEGAAAYSGESPHPIVLIQPDGRPHPSCVSVPSAWGSRLVADLQLVALIGDPTSVEIQRCPYSGAPDVVRYQYELTVALHEATTGLTLSTTTLMGAPPRLCGATEAIELTRLDGERITDVQILDWLAPFVATGIDLEWYRVPHSEAAFGDTGRQEMLSVVAGGPGVVAVGLDGYSNDGVAAVWTSVDGLEWSRVAHDEAVFGGAGTRVMHSVVAGGPGLVAVGRDATQGVAAVWTSVDGLEWSRVAHDETVFGGPGTQMMRSVAAGGPGMVAVGYSETEEEWAAAVWTSVDGLAWSRVTHDEAVFGGGERQEMYSVAAGGPGMVAVGYSATEEEWAAAVWTSVDGLAWSRVTHNEAVFGGAEFQEMYSVAAGGPGLVAVGYDSSQGDGGAAVWTSVDGLNWSRAPRDEASFGGPDDQAMLSVVAGGPGMIAVGADGDSAAIWTSVDGLAWSQIPPQEATFGSLGSQVIGSPVIKAVAAAGPGLVAVGHDGSMGRGVAAVWVSPPPAAQ